LPWRSISTHEGNSKNKKSLRYFPIPSFAVEVLRPRQFELPDDRLGVGARRVKVDAMIAKPRGASRSAICLCWGIWSKHGTTPFGPEFDEHYLADVVTGIDFAAIKRGELNGHGFPMLSINWMHRATF